jgi:predicted RNase H-like HicB family nuclease
MLAKAIMRDGRNRFDFTGAFYKEGKWFVSLCLDVDVASQGRTAREARRMLAEAVSLYLEGCFESNIPCLRPVPKDQDPRFNQPENFVGLFPLRVAFKVRAVA